MLPIKKLLPKSTFILSEDQKDRFKEYIPNKVYYTERNVSILVALTQLSMIIMFLVNQKLAFHNSRSIAYFSLYVFLFLATCLALVLYRYTVKNKKYQAFLWLRRIYAVSLCIWVVGITFLEQMPGKGITVFCYLLPTTAAVLMLNPIESTLIFGGTWIGLAAMLMTMGSREGSLFGNLVNSIFVTVLTLFISYRYYRSMATEFKDREVIATQYDEIQKTNSQLEQMVHRDNLTGLYNRHFFQEKIYPMFEECRNKNFDGMVLMMDIDFFKQFNDKYGHMQGDVCLKELAGVIQKLCREEDAAAIRFGGEEFLMIRMSEQLYDAERFAERLMVRIGAKNIVRDDTDSGRVTVSMGLWHGSLSGISHIEQAVKLADDALYKAKSQGRNRIAYANQQKQN